MFNQYHYNLMINGKIKFPRYNMVNFLGRYYIGTYHEEFL